MRPSGINAHQYSRSASSHLVPNFTSSSPMNSSSTNVDAILAQSLPGALSAPAGWRSEIASSVSSTATHTGVNLNNSYEGYNTANTFNSAQFNQIPSPVINDRTAYLSTPIDESSVHQQQYGLVHQQQQQNTIHNVEHQQQTELTHQQQQNIIHRVEQQQPPPLIVRKTLPNNLVTYKQNVSVRYLQPPTPPPPGPLIIREVRPPQPPPQPPLNIRQRPPPPPTPPPLVLREKPPPLPPRTPSKVVEKLLPTPPRPPRRVIVERYAACPPKPADVVIERWLPYKQTDQRRILIERAPAPFIQPQEPNLLVLHDAPRAHVNRQFINQGVTRADPDSYLQRYGAELNTWHTQHSSLIGEATRAVPPPLDTVGSRHYHGDSHLDDYHYGSSPYTSSSWDRTRVVSPIPRSSSYHYSSSRYDSPDDYCNQSSHGYGIETSRSYADYPTRRENYLTMTDVTPSWKHYCNSPSYDSHYSSSYRSSYPAKTIRVNSDNELQHVLSDLTHGHVPSALRSY